MRQIISTPDSTEADFKLLDASRNLWTSVRDESRLQLWNQTMWNKNVLNKYYCI
jgi:hypothetical protein